MRNEIEKGIIFVAATKILSILNKTPLVILAQPNVTICQIFGNITKSKSNANAVQ